MSPGYYADTSSDPGQFWRASQWQALSDEMKDCGCFPLRCSSPDILPEQTVQRSDLQPGWPTTARLSQKSNVQAPDEDFVHNNILLVTQGGFVVLSGRMLALAAHSSPYACCRRVK